MPLQVVDLFVGGLRERTIGCRAVCGGEGLSKCLYTCLARVSIERDTDNRYGCCAPIALAIIFGLARGRASLIWDLSISDEAESEFGAAAIWVCLRLGRPDGLAPPRLGGIDGPSTAPARSQSIEKKDQGGLAPRFSMLLCERVEAGSSSLLLQVPSQGVPSLLADGGVLVLPSPSCWQPPAARGGPPPPPLMGCVLLNRG